MNFPSPRCNCQRRRTPISVCRRYNLGCNWSGINYLENWKLVINTSTTIITFLMVFLIQSSQNWDGAALQAKLDALILANEAQNKYVAIEQLSGEEIEALRTGIGERAANPDLTIAPSVTANN